MDDEAVEVLDLTQACGSDGLPCTASLRKPPSGDSEGNDQSNAHTVPPSNHSMSLNSGSLRNSTAKNDQAKLTATGLHEVRPQTPASFGNTEAKRRCRALQSRARTPSPAFRRPRLPLRADHMDDDSISEQTGLKTPATSRKRTHEKMLTPPSTQAVRNTSWSYALAARRRERLLRNDRRHKNAMIDQSSPLAKMTKWAHTSNPTVDNGFLTDGRRIEASLNSLLRQGGALVDSSALTSDTDAVAGTPAASQPTSVDEPSDAPNHPQLSPAQRRELWSKFTEDEETGQLKFCDCESHRSSNSEDQRADRERRTNHPSESHGDAQHLSVKTKQCQSCGGAKVKQDKRELFARQWQELFGPGAAASQQLGVERPEVAARLVRLGDGSLLDSVDGPSLEGHSPDLNAAPGTEMDRLVAVNEQLRTTIMELLCKLDVGVQLKTIATRQEASNAASKESLANLKTEFRELQKHMDKTFFNFAEQMSTAIEDQSRLVTAAGSRRTRIGDLPQDRMLEAAEALRRRFASSDEEE